MNCHSKYTCGPLYSSHCVQYMGTKLTSVEESRFVYDVRVSDVLQELDRVVKALQDATSLKDFPQSCLTVKDTDTVRSLLDQIAGKLCNLDQALGKAVDAAKPEAVGSLIIGASLDCLTDGCTRPDTRTLKQSLELLARELCALKSQVATLQSTGSSGANLYIPS